MSARPSTTPIYTRIPETALKDLDEAAAEEFQSRSGMVTRIVLEWLKQWRAIKKDQGKKK